jgi:hypothetical protein
MNGHQGRRARKLGSYVDFIAVLVVKGQRPLVPHYSRQTADTAVGKVRALVPTEDITRSILVVRSHRVLLDNELAALYQVTTKRFNEQVRRNRKRFPADFMFQLTAEELSSLRSQIATLKLGRGQHRKYLPYASAPLKYPARWQP